MPENIVLLFLVAMLGCGLLGFAAGFWGFKIRTRWCSICGAALNCPACSSAGAHRLSGSR